MKTTTLEMFMFIGIGAALGLIVTFVTVAHVLPDVCWGR